MNYSGTGQHALSVGGDDYFTLNYIWNAQAFGSDITSVSGDSNASDNGYYGEVVGPNFSVSGSTLTISNLSGSETRLWQQTFLVRFY